jgi:hypothetical protein
MNANEMLANLLMPARVLVEQHMGEKDACDVIVEMENGTIYTALFVIPSYFQRQMALSLAVTREIPDTTPVRYAIVDTPHIVVESLDRDTIEDTIDNLLALEVFEGLFTQVTEEEDATEPTRTTRTGKGQRATQEVAAVVLSDVLVVEG